MATHTKTPNHTPERRVPGWTMDEAAVALGLHPVTVQRLIRQGKLNNVRVGRFVYVTTAGIVGYMIEALTNPSTRDYTLARLTALAAELGVPFDPEAVMADVANLAGSSSPVLATRRATEALEVSA